MAAHAAERIAVLIGKFVCEDVGLYEFVRQNPSFLEKKVVDGKNLLHLAVQSDDVELVEKILDAGFNKVLHTMVVNEPDDNKYWTPLSYAAFQRNVDLVNLLLAAGANPSNGAPLLFACQYDEACAARLMEAGADVNDMYAETGETCLHAAVRGGRLWVIHQLLHQGADPTRTDANGVTPSALAAEFDNPDLAALLRKAEQTWPQMREKLRMQRAKLQDERVKSLLPAKQSVYPFGRTLFVVNKRRPNDQLLPKVHRWSVVESSHHPNILKVKNALDEKWHYLCIMCNNYTTPRKSNMDRHVRIHFRDYPLDRRFRHVRVPQEEPLQSDFIWKH
ncbi:unnamed protein product [Notodromas monacha]|uniref:Uncharacterized protein n=1 Tax=Notodromas monacha TaxID=399045 RepID=A0A7R9GBM4_9CRUS|nr:unnamed protein product [Notodromas monacha]CAG0916532.1 unnamed protein product [Notodromas monacha]